MALYFIKYRTDINNTIIDSQTNSYGGTLGVNEAEQQIDDTVFLKPFPDQNWYLWRWTGIIIEENSVGNIDTYLSEIITPEQVELDLQQEILDRQAADALKLDKGTYIGDAQDLKNDIDSKASATQGALADSALQPGDNISELINDSGFLNTETDPIFSASEANNFVAGDKTNLDNQSGINTGDETISTIQTKRPLRTIEGQSLEGVGNIDLDKTDIGLDQVDNTSDLNKPISTATQVAINNEITARQNGDNGTVSIHSDMNTSIATSDDKELLVNNGAGIFEPRTIEADDLDDFLTLPSKQIGDRFIYNGTNWVPNRDIYLRQPQNGEGNRAIQTTLADTPVDIINENINLTAGTYEFQVACSFNRDDNTGDVILKLNVNGSSVEELTDEILRIEGKDSAGQFNIGSIVTATNQKKVFYRPYLVIIPTTGNIPVLFTLEGNTAGVEKTVWNGFIKIIKIT